MREFRKSSVFALHVSFFLFSFLFKDGSKSVKLKFWYVIVIKISIARSEEGKVIIFFKRIPI